MAETLHAPPPIAGSISRGSFRDTRVADNFSPFSSVMEYNAMSRQMAAPGAPFLHGVRPGSLYTNATPAAKPRKIENLSRRDSMESFYVEQTHVGRAHPHPDEVFSDHGSYMQTAGPRHPHAPSHNPSRAPSNVPSHVPSRAPSHVPSHFPPSRAPSNLPPHIPPHVLSQLSHAPSHTGSLAPPSSGQFPFPLQPPSHTPSQLRQVPSAGSGPMQMNIHHATPPRSRAGSDPDSPRRTSFYGSPNDLPPRTPSKDGHHDRHRPSEASKGRSVKRSGTIRRKPPPDSFGPSSIGTPYMHSRNPSQNGRPVSMQGSIRSIPKRHGAFPFEHGANDDLIARVWLPWTDRLELHPCTFHVIGPGNQLYTLEVDYQWAKMVHGTAKFHGGGFGGRGRLIVEWEIAFHLEKHTDGSDSD